MPSRQIHRKRHYYRKQYPLEQFQSADRREIFFFFQRKMLGYLNCKNDLWVRDCYACTEPAYQLNIRVINENPWSNLFAYNMFLRPKEDDLENFVPEWTILQAPGFSADLPQTEQEHNNFAIISFTHKTILIRGTGYTGEMKKGILPYSIIFCRKTSKC